MENGTVVVAHYAGRCKRCGAPVAIGDRIMKAGPRQWVCAACGHLPAASANEGAAAAPPAAFDADSFRRLIRAELEGAELAVDEQGIRLVAREELLKAGLVKTVVEVKTATGDVRQIEGKAHAAFARVLQLAAARRNVLLVGPAGSGKTHLASQVAEALGLPFSHISCSAGMSEGQLMGRLIPTGEGGRFEYVRSEFVKAYEEGGVFLFDEIDAADSNTLLVINSALANGCMAVPNRPDNPVAKRHPDFVAIAAANTFGTGADRQYVGRNQLDESTLDRFRIGQVEMDYDPDVETALCPDDGLRDRLQGYRARIRQAKLRRVVSTRFLRDAYLMTQVGWTDADVDQALFLGWSEDEICKVKG